MMTMRLTHLSYNAPAASVWCHQVHTKFTFSPACATVPLIASIAQCFTLTEGQTVNLILCSKDSCNAPIFKSSCSPQVFHRKVSYASFSVSQGITRLENGHDSKYNHPSQGRGSTPKSGLQVCSVQTQKRQTRQACRDKQRDGDTAVSEKVVRSSPLGRLRPTDDRPVGRAP